MPPRKNAAEASAAKAAKAKKAAEDQFLGRGQRAAAVMANINAKMKGRAVVKAASDYVLPYLTKRIPTGVLSLDLALRGGFPAGGLSQIAGPKNSGKSWLTWQLIRQLQYYLGDSMSVLLAMTEMRADRSQARLAGVKIAMGDEDIAMMELARKTNNLPPFTKEEVEDLKTEVGTIHEAHGMAAEDLYDVILAGVEANAYHLIVLDSIGSLMSGLEAEAESMSEKTYGGNAGVNTQFCRKLSGLLTIDDDNGKARDVSVVCINQVRENIKDPNKAWRTPGGQALEHTKFVDVWVNSGSLIGAEEKVYTPQGTKARFQQHGKEVNWNIAKGKAGIHEGARGSYIYDFRINNVDFYLDTLVVGVREGIVEQAGAWLGIRNPENPEGYLVRGQGKDAFIQALVQNAQQCAVEDRSEDSLVNYIRNQVFKKNGINVLHTWE